MVHQKLRDFCGFSVVPDASKFTRFKQDFLDGLQSMFHRLVDMAEPICQQIDAAKASMLLFDTSGIEAWVAENNPKYANRIIKQLKAYKKAKNLDGSYGPYKAAYGPMPPHADANPAIQQIYINGHFCYAYKFGIATNGLGIVRDKKNQSVYAIVETHAQHLPADACFTSTRRKTSGLIREPCAERKNGPKPIKSV